jgi:hypothetical protein
MNINQYPDDLKVTAAMLSVILALKTAGNHFHYESCMAEHLNLPAPGDWFKRSEKLFSDYAPHLAAVGLSSNAITLDAIHRYEVPAGVMNTDYSLLPAHWIFNPLRGWRQV